MTKLLDKILQFFKGTSKTKVQAQEMPRPKVKRQNAVPSLSKQSIEHKAHRESPNKNSVDKKVAESKEAKKKTPETKTGVAKNHSEANKPLTDPNKPKRRKYYHKKFKGKKPSGTEGKSGPSK